jgi:hypothetical protein
MGRTPTNSRLSRNRFSTIHCGSVDPIIRYTDPHLTKRSRYLANWDRSWSLGGRPRTARKPSSKGDGSRRELWRLRLAHSPLTRHGPTDPSTTAAGSATRWT